MVLRFKEYRCQNYCSCKTCSGNYVGLLCWVDLGNKELKKNTLEITSFQGGGGNAFCRSGIRILHRY